MEDSGERDETGEEGNTSGAEARELVPYDSKPPCGPMRSVSPDHHKPS